MLISASALGSHETVSFVSSDPSPLQASHVHQILNPPAEHLAMPSGTNGSPRSTIPTKDANVSAPLRSESDRTFVSADRSTRRR